MSRSRIAYTVLALLLACAAPARSEPTCTLIYGKTWAFVMDAPAGWLSRCRAERLMGAAVALWPEDSTFADAPAVMYITVSTRTDPTLEAFAAGEQARFRASAPEVRFVAIEPAPIVGGRQALLFGASGDPGRNEERIAYVEGPTAYFILVASARTAQDLERSRAAFDALLESFVPMESRTQP